MIPAGLANATQCSRIVSNNSNSLMHFKLVYVSLPSSTDKPFLTWICLSISIILHPADGRAVSGKHADKFHSGHLSSSCAALPCRSCLPVLTHVASYLFLFLLLTCVVLSVYFPGYDQPVSLQSRSLRTTQLLGLKTECRICTL